MVELSRKESSKVGIAFGTILLITVLALSNTFRTAFYNIDLGFFNFFGNFDSLVALMKVITLFGDWEILVPTGIILSILIYRRDKNYAIIFTSSIIITQGIVFLLKNLFQRARPPVGYIIENGFSFPSGHTTTSLVFYILLSYFIIYSWKSKSKYLVCTLLIILALLVCFSRIILNVHWFSDIILGFLIALSIILIALSTYNEIKK